MIRAAIRKTLRHFELDVELAAADGETLVIVGPSGCGKTTTLDCIAGLTPPDAGTVDLAGERVFDAAGLIDVPVEARRVGYVFQDYALFPHMTVFDNVAYGLRARHAPRATVKERVRGMLESLHIESLADVRPGGLSGGEKQRVALARALAIDPGVLLLDEPLGALDASMRRHVRRELKRILQSLGTATILVTHDYEDALALANRILVMDRGQVVQYGTREDLLYHPKSRFVADFTAVNYFEGEARPGIPGPREIRIGNGVLHASADAIGDVSVSFFPTDVMVAIEEPHTSAQNVFRGKVHEIVHFGDRFRIHIEAEIPIVAEMTDRAFRELGICEGREVYAFFKATAVRVSA